MKHYSTAKMSPQQAISASAVTLRACHDMKPHKITIEALRERTGLEWQTQQEVLRALRDHGFVEFQKMPRKLTEPGLSRNTRLRGLLKSFGYNELLRYGDEP